MSEVVDELVRQMKTPNVKTEKEIKANKKIYLKLAHKFEKERVKALEKKKKEYLQSRKKFAKRFDKIANARMVSKRVIKSERPTVRLRSSRQPQEYKSIYFKV